MTRIRGLIARLLIAATTLIPAVAHAQVPRTIDYQGYLTTSGGVPVNASVSMSFALYEEPAGGSPLWTEAQTVPVSNGNYHVALGSVSPLVLPFDRPYYLGVTVGGDAEMLPRHPLSSAPYALRAGCNTGDMINCYDGPGGTLNVGACRAGVRTCNETGTAYGPCTGQVTPLAEVCGNAIDDNCDGQQNDGCGSPTCSVGTPTTCGTGACFRSVACTTGYESCSPGAPVAEMCNGIDDNCNGVVDVDAFPTLGQACSAYDAGTGSCQSGVYVCSANQLGVQCSAGSTSCLDAPPSLVSAQIATARASPDGPADLPVNGAFVTYVKPAIGADAAGFFVQAETTGPALFVAVPPASLSPAPVAGDKLSFTISAMSTAAGRRQAMAVSAFVRLSQGNSLVGLAQEVSGAGDLVSNLAAYESELISISRSLASGFLPSGTGYAAASFEAGLQLRLPADLAAGMDLATGCTVTLQRVPLWRTNATAQVSAWSAADFAAVLCPRPMIVGTLALSSTSLRVTFDRLIDPASVSASGSDFSIDGGLTVSAASASGKTVVLTTSAQTPGALYNVTVGAGVTDTYGAIVSPTGNPAAFTGYVTVATLLLNEVAPNIPSSRDLIELRALSGGTLSGITVVQDPVAGSVGAVLATLPNVTVATGELIVIHLSADLSAVTGESISKTEGAGSGNYAGAWDIIGNNAGVTYSNRVLAVIAPDGTTIQDAVAFALTGTSAPASFVPALQYIQGLGHWLPANSAGQPTTYETSPTAPEISAIWNGAGTTPGGNTVRRDSGGTDTNAAGDWSVGASTLGSAN